MLTVLIVVVFIRYAVIAPVIVIERKGVFASMSRAARLSKGHRWKILAVWMLLFAATMVALVISGVLVGLLGVLVGYLIGGLMQLVVMPYMAAAFTVLYAELRRIADGETAEPIAQVFD